MRRMLTISALAALALGATAATAQAQTKTMGIVAGVDFSRLTGSDWDTYYGSSQSRTGFIGGFFVGIPVGGGNVTIEPEALYVNKGGKGSISSTDINVTTDYIQVPVLIKWSSQPNSTGISLFAGPGVSFSVGCNIKVSDTGGSTSQSCSDADVSANTVVSGTVGVGFSKGRAGIEGRYGFDWGDAFKDKVANSNLSVKNSVWSILVRFTK